jgi:hypothetical protein
MIESKFMPKGQPIFSSSQQTKASLKLEEAMAK